MLHIAIGGGHELTARIPIVALVIAAIVSLVLLVGILSFVFVKRQASPAVPSSSAPASPTKAAGLPVTRRTAVLLALSGVAAAGLLAAAPAAADVVQRHVLPAPLPRTDTGPRMATDAATGPNVLLVTVDTLRADQLGCYGNAYMQTPTLDKLAAGGARCAWHMVQEPQTDPSHGSIFTGMYPSSSGIRIHMVDKLSDSLNSLATLFQKAGYSTAGLFSFMALDAQYTNFQRGFQVYQDLTGFAQVVVPATTPGPGENDDLPFVKGHADQTTDAAIAQLKAFRNQPFFLWVHYFDPHVPYQPPAPYDTMYDTNYSGPVDGSLDTLNNILSGQLIPAGADLRRLISLYQGEISFFDSQLARLIASLDQLGMGQNTVVAVTGDHGESFFEHSDFVVTGDIFHPCSLYNPEGQVPLLLRYPPRVRPGTVVSAPTQAIDIFPTLLDLAGLPIPDQAQGRSLVSLFDGTDNGSTRVAFAAMPDYVFTSIVVPGWKLIQNNATGQRHMYDLSGDPNELTDVLTAHADTADQLTARLQSWMKQVKISS